MFVLVLVQLPVIVHGFGCIVYGRPPDTDDTDTVKHRIRDAADAVPYNLNAGFVPSSNHATKTTFFNKTN